MALNPYFQQGSRSEQNLVQDKKKSKELDAGGQ